VVLPAPHRDRGFVHAPGGAHGPRVSRPALLEFRYIPQYPAQDGCVGYGNAPLGHHRHQIAVTEPVGDVPANADLNDLDRVPPTAVDRVALYWFCHSASPR